MKLIGFPYAGGQAACYRDLAIRLPGVSLLCAELPGHGRRMRERLLTDCRSMLDDLWPRIRPALQPPYGLFGHSMGAMLAWLMARRIRAEQMALPCALIVSARQGPSLPDRQRRFALPDHAFVEQLLELGGCPPDLMAHPDVRNLFLPILRADFQAVETWAYQPEPPLEVPIIALMGQGDALRRDEILAWQSETTCPLDVRSFPGGHFFLTAHWDDVAGLVRRALAVSPDSSTLNRLES